MSVIETIINFADSVKNKTISELLDDCIETAENTSQPIINIDWFIELKSKIEEELKDYAWGHLIAPNYLLNNNCVNITEKSLEITNKEKNFIYLTIYFPSEFNPNSLIIERNYC